MLEATEESFIIAAHEKMLQVFPKEYIVENV